MHAFGQREQERTAGVPRKTTRRRAVEQHLFRLPSLRGLRQGERRIGLGVRLEPDSSGRPRPRPARGRRKRTPARISAVATAAASAPPGVPVSGVSACPRRGERQRDREQDPTVAGAILSQRSSRGRPSRDTQSAGTRTAASVTSTMPAMRHRPTQIVVSTIRRMACEGSTGPPHCSGATGSSSGGPRPVLQLSPRRVSVENEIGQEAFADEAGRRGRLTARPRCPARRSPAAGRGILLRDHFRCGCGCPPSANS